MKSDNLHLPLRCRHHCARTMLMKEYRICMPLTVEEVGEVFFVFTMFCIPLCLLIFLLFHHKSAANSHRGAGFVCLFTVVLTVEAIIAKLSVMRFSFCTKGHIELQQPRCGLAATAGWSCCCLSLRGEKSCNLQNCERGCVQHHHHQRQKRDWCDYYR